MATATITSKGQMTIPKSIRDLLDLKPGDKVDLVPDEQGGVILRRRKIRKIEDLFGIIPKGTLPPTDSDFDEMIADAILEADERTRSGR